MACRHIAFRCTYALPCHTPQPNLIQAPKQPPGVPDSGWGVKFPHLVRRRLEPCLRRPHPADNDSSVVLRPTASHARIPALRHCQPDLYSALPHLCAAGGVSLDPHPHPHPHPAPLSLYPFPFPFPSHLSSQSTLNAGFRPCARLTRAAGSCLTPHPSMHSLMLGSRSALGASRKSTPLKRQSAAPFTTGIAHHPRSPTPPPRCQRYRADVTFGCTQDLPS